MYYELNQIELENYLLIDHVTGTTNHNNKSDTDDSSPLVTLGRRKSKYFEDNSSTKSLKMIQLHPKIKLLISFN